MKLSAHQPAYLPWLGYFDKIARADVFVFLDSVQFEKSSFTNRNRIKTPQGAQWLTIPLKMKGHLSATIAQMLIDEAQPWRAKHLKSIEANYARAPFFKAGFPELQPLLMQDADNLAELCWQQLQFWLRVLDIRTPIYRSSQLPIEARKSELVLSMCQHFGADEYLSGALGRDYLDEAAFARAGINIEYQDYPHPQYPQLWGGFEARLSVVDAWLNCGAAAAGFLGRRA
jgi:hypothetical protein